MITKAAALREIETYGRGPQFLANVIVNGCSNPARKLRGIVKLLRAGHSVGCTQFSTMDVMIDGSHRGGLAILEDHA